MEQTEIYYCPKCGAKVPTPIQKQNPKGFYLETNCQECGARIISDELKNFCTEDWLKGGRKKPYEVFPL